MQKIWKNIKYYVYVIIFFVLFYGGAALIEKLAEIFDH